MSPGPSEQVLAAPHAAPGRAGSDVARHRTGLLLVAAASITWSTGGLIARFIEAGPWTIVFWRGVACASFLLLFLAVRERGKVWPLFRAAGLPGIVAALCFATASTAFILALQVATVASILIVQNTGPFIAALLAWVLMREHVQIRTWIALVVAAAGITVMVSNQAIGGGLVGLGLSLTTAFAFAAATVTIRYHRAVRMTPAACLASCFGALIALPLAEPFGVSTKDFGLMWLFGVGQLGIGMVLFTTGARMVPAAEASLITVLETVFAGIWVWLALGENPGMATIAGGALVLAAVVGHTLADLRRKR
jgi:drug/metabolite transporter (DMT)-like permease